MRFWILKEWDKYTRELTGTCVYDRVEPSNLGDCPVVCPNCKKVCGPMVWLPPYNVRLSKPKYGDLVLGPGFELLVSENFKKIYLNSGLSGLPEFHSIDNLMVSGLSKKSRKIPTYYIVRPNILFTVLDEIASGLVWKKPPDCDYCRLGVRAEIKKVVVNQDSWEGKDIFMATGLYSLILVTERFVEVVQKANLTNFFFVPADQFSEKW